MSFHSQGEEKTQTDSYSWSKNGEWKERYSKMYSCRGISVSKPRKEDPTRISFMSNELQFTPRGNSFDVAGAAAISTLSSRIARHESLLPPLGDKLSNCLLSARSEECCSDAVSQESMENNDTILLDMVRTRHREMLEEAQDQPLDLPKDDPEDDEISIENCVRGLGLRMTDRSISRSRVSRISTRRDMDIPSILAFTSTCPIPVHLEIPAFQKIRSDPQQEELPRWSIRRSVCPVCSQKWKDRSSISNVKSSGLKRNSSSDLPSVIAPARLRTSITSAYVPRPALFAVDEDAGISKGGLRNTSAAWQLTRARRFRIPKPQMPPPEASLPPSSTAPLARKDLDQRVTKFLKDEFLNRPFTNPH